MKQTLLTYTAYNTWANSRMAGLLETHHALLDMPVKSSFPSLRKTFYHIWGAEELWHKRLHGESLSYVPAMDFAGSFREAADSLRSVSGKFSALVHEKDEAYLKTGCPYKDTRGNAWTQPRWQMIFHCMNHSAFHRGQLVTLLRQLDVTVIPPTDLVVYFRESGG